MRAHDDICEAVSEGCALMVVATHLVGPPLLGLPYTLLPLVLGGCC